MIFDKKEGFERLDTAYLRYSPLGMQRVYGVNISIRQGLETNKLSYEISAKCWQDIVEGNYVFEFDRTNFRINGYLRPETIVDDLALKCGSVIYPLQLFINRRNEMLSVRNYQNIKDRWLVVKKNILASYEGKAVSIYLQATESNILSEEKFTKAIGQDWFLAHFLKDIYLNYGIRHHVEGEFSMAVFPQVAPISFEVSQKLDYYYSSYNSVKITVQGTAENRFYSNLSSQNNTKLGYEGVNGGMNIAYELDNKTYIIQSIISNIHIQQIDLGEMNVIFKAYHLAEKDLTR